MNQSCVEKKKFVVCRKKWSEVHIIAFFVQEANLLKVNDSVCLLFPGKEFAERGQYCKSDLTDSPEVQ